MASRTKQKEEARARRLAEEHSRLEQARRRRRLQMVAGVVVAAIVVVAVAIAISSGGGSTKAPSVNSGAATQASTSVNTLVGGIPQSGTRLGSPTAKVTVTEWGDLECPICKEFALGAESTLIGNDVRAGRVQLVYRSLETASSGSPIPNVFPTQQAAALAAGQQNRAWNYILLFYQLQGEEDTGYATPTFLNRLAALTPGLNFARWQSARSSSGLTAQVAADEQAAQNRGFDSTPSVLVQGPKGQAQPIVGAVDYGTLESAIKSVS